MTDHLPGNEDKIAVSLSGKKDTWDILAIVASALIPLMVVLVGHWLSEQQKQANEIARQADRLSILIRHLASDNPRERKLAVNISSYLADNGQLPKEIVPALIDLADTEESSEVARAASTALAHIEVKAPELKEQIQRSAINIAPRVYFHINRESQRAPARALAARLIAGSSDIELVVPGIERANGPENSQFRFFRKDEAAEAQKIAADIRRLGFPVQLVDLSARYPDSGNIRPRHYELWLGNDFQ